MAEVAELVRRTGTALREPSDDVPSLLERLGRALNASALAVLRPQSTGVIVDFAWWLHEWWLGTKPVPALSPHDLVEMPPLQVVELAAASSDIPPQLWWDAGRATTAPVVVGVAGADGRLRERGTAMLATALDVVVARQIASADARMNALLQERARMASAMHEGVAQDLATLSLQLEVLEEMIPRDPAGAGRLLSDARATATSALDHVRSAISDLTPVVPHDTWLLTGLRTFVDDFGRRWDLDLTFTHEGSWRIVKPDALGLVFAFVQEALTNVRKHAARRQGHVHVHFDEESLEVSVRSEGTSGQTADDGQIWSSGHGLKLMRGRARLLGGDVRLWCRRGGTTIASLRLVL